LNLKISDEITIYTEVSTGRRFTTAIDAICYPEDDEVVMSGFTDDMRYIIPMLTHEALHLACHKNKLIHNDYYLIKIQNMIGQTANRPKRTL